nr:GspE/PulE family protein [Derxia lacustris]
MVGEADIAAIRRVPGQTGRAMHPLETLAEARLRIASGERIGELLTPDALAEWLAGQTGLGYFHIDPLKVDFTRIADVMSSAYATRYGILPVEVRGNDILVATCEPGLDDWVASIEKATRKAVRRVIANPRDIERYTVEFYNLARSVKGASRINHGGAANNFEQLIQLGAQIASGARAIDQNDAHIVQIVDWLWQYAFEQRASDIHLEPKRDIGIVRFRIDGVLHQVYQVPVAVMTAMVARVKLLGRMDVVEKRRPLDGRIKTKTPGGLEVELRLSTLPTAFGEKLVMRIFDPEVLVRDFAALGFGDDDAARWTGMTARPHGIILVTGPTGSGKTTTLYSTLKLLATDEVNVCTVEDPIEMVEPAFNQMQVQHGIDLSFADGVRALMRQDPDIIMVGEIRDLETAETAIQAALTGHLVLSTLHTNDAPSAISRLLELGVPAYLLNATLLGVLAQRLVRTLCPECKRPASADERLTDDAWNEFIAPWKAAPPAQVFRPVGCLECRMTGYHGRSGIYELLVMSERLKALVHDKPDIAALRQAAIREGMRPLRVGGARKVAHGVTTFEEVLKCVPPADATD